MAIALDRSTWTLTDAAAVWTDAGSGMGDVRLDPRHPDLGLVGSLARVSDDRLLGIDLRGPARLADLWTRGGDLLAVYETADARRVRATAMWRSIGGRLAATEGVTAWEVIVSAQTALLESDAALAVTGHVRATSILRTASHLPEAGNDLVWTERPAAVPRTRAILVRREAPSGAAATSVVIALHADEGNGVVARIEGGHARVECRLFGDSLEKGVLLRSRVLAAVGPATGDETWASRLVRGFAALPPMLDT